MTPEADGEPGDRVGDLIARALPPSVWAYSCSHIPVPDGSHRTTGRFRIALVAGRFSGLRVGRGFTGTGTGTAMGDGTAMTPVPMRSATIGGIWCAGAASEAPADRTRPPSAVAMTRVARYPSRRSSR